ncbi:ras-related protein RABA3-like [Camellia sinensis]|uniref:ras-related protein RABA3-like n=1 Tax=Camellia sinensis TaxID=4442 RepID=UPI0010359981|nr:ras-related protein RABA3-like [Camellia sinensis]
MELDGKEIRAQVWDTAGQERFRTVTFAYYKGAVGALIIYDITRRTTFDSIKRWLDELKRLPSSPPFEGSMGNGPSGSAGSQQFPITADIVYKDPNVNSKTIFIIALSALVILVVCCGAISIILKCRMVGRPSNAVGPVFTPAANKRLRKFVCLFLLVRNDTHNWI